MFDELSDPPPGLVKRRVTVRQIAEKAQVSVATVDRVINGRTTVRRASALRVQSAAQALGYQFTVPVRVRLDAAPQSAKCAFLLQKKSSYFYQQIVDELNQAVRSDPSDNLELTVELMDDYL